MIRSLQWTRRCSLHSEDSHHNDAPSQAAHRAEVHRVGGTRQSRASWWVGFEGGW